MNRTIKEALIAEEKFFRNHPVRMNHCFVISNIRYMSLLDTDIFSVQFKIYSGLADSCGVPQLAKKLNKVGFAMLKTPISFCYLFSLMLALITRSAYIYY